MTIPASVRDRASTAALSMGTGIAVLSIVQLEADRYRYPYPFFGDFTTFGPFASPMVIVYVGWFIALVTAIMGFTLAARLIALATIPLTVAARIIADGTGMLMRPTWTFLGLMISLAVLVVAGRPVPNRRGVVWCVVWLVSSVAAFLLPQLANPGGSAFQDPTWLDRPMVVVWSPILVVGLAIILSLLRLRHWSAAVVLVGLPWTAVALFGRIGPTGARELAVILALAVLTPIVLLRLFGFKIRVIRA